MKKLTQKTRRMLSVVLAACLLLTATVGIGATVSAETTLKTLHVGDYTGGASQSDYVTVSVVPGTTYTFTSQFKANEGCMWVMLNGNAVGLEDGSDALKLLTYESGTYTESNGATYDTDNSQIKYTFTAQGATLNIYVQRDGSWGSHGGDKEIFWFANPTLTAADGTPVDCDPDFDTWTCTDGKSSITDYDAEWFGIKVETDLDVIDPDSVTLKTMHVNTFTSGQGQGTKYTLNVAANTTYTFTAQFKAIGGLMWVYLNDSAVGGNEIRVAQFESGVYTFADGVTYNEYTSTLSYTFTSQGTTLEIGVYRDGSWGSHGGDEEIFWFANPTLTDTEGTALNCDPDFDSWVASGDSAEQILDYDADFFGTEPDTGVAEDGKLYGYAASSWTNPGGGNSVYTTVTGLTVGTQYTFSCKWRYAKGNVGVSIDNVGAIGDAQDTYTVVFQDTPGEGVTYDEVTGTYTYTFTAVSTSAQIAIANDSTSDMEYVYWFALPKLVREDGFVVDMDANFDSGKWNKYLAGPDPTTLNPTLFTAVGRVGGQMVSGASIRYNEPTGLRFQSHYLGLERLAALKEAGKIADYACGTIILPADYLVEGVELTKASLVANGVNHLDIPTTVWAEDYVYGETTYDVANAVIANIKPANYGRDFTAIGYTMVTYLDGSVEYDYLDTSVTRSVSDVATALKADTETYEALSDTMKGIVDGFIVE